VALGAQRGDVLRLVVVRGMKLAVAGVGFGIAAAIDLTSLMKTLLFGVGPLDIATFTAVPVLLLAAALIACYIPARRAARADPRVALSRNEPVTMTGVSSLSSTAG
jgi:putative ABC transport system permease protein